ncbi:MAG: hypothetical protein ACI841_004428 [Planctomycetota bacterium]|jgi:hypothetical protein
MRQFDSMIHSDQDTATAHRPLWLRVAHDPRRHERLLGLVLWVSLFAVLFDFDW